MCVCVCVWRLQEDDCSQSGVEYEKGSIWTYTFVNSHLTNCYDTSKAINPLTPELNAPVQHCLPELFTGDFKFLCLLLEKKAYLVDFSFKFN